MAWPVLFLLGISAGAGLVVVLLVSLGLWQVWVPFGAWLGAIATTLMVYLLARTGTTISVERLILGGVAFSSLFGAVQSMLLLMTQDGRVQAALTWLIGSLNGRGWREVTVAAPAILLALALGCLLSRQVNLLVLGDELAVGLGTSLVRSRCLIGATATPAGRQCRQHRRTGGLCWPDRAPRGAAAGGHRLPTGAALFGPGGVRWCWLPPI